ncbi:hypothetical protein CYLTODRAFT_452257 [Cylindrobasidium torrendii FP15055 ss-10]|uniref:Uncharacterized protein n=1 Tax=Cylindrobasidium torrendii FP15055 ss-10 TaxID=1314674 RepID=A0A0D7BHE6_9AGAR|nr:hypothetical protein CYLTODRAFT_452257 [Cylindrobasidium torrendii FP15055 ss-10]
MSTELLKVDQVWAIERRPLEKVIATFDGTIDLPLTFRGAAKIHKSFREGDDINQLVFQFYCQRPGKIEGNNYVDPESLDPRKHEYLGPRPMVARYIVNTKQRIVDVEWLDKYLQTKWIAGQ